MEINESDEHILLMNILWDTYMLDDQIVVCEILHNRFSHVPHGSSIFITKGEKIIL